MDEKIVIVFRIGIKKKLEWRTLPSLFETYEWIGFIPDEEGKTLKKYLIVSKIKGEVPSYAVGKAVSCDKIFNTQDIPGEYFVFDTKNELLKWMMD